MMILNPDCYTALNARKQLVACNKLDVLDELRVLQPVFTVPRNIKSSVLWHHRKWLVQRIAHKSSLEFWQAELALTERAFTLYPKNYYAWSYRTWLLHQLSTGECLEELRWSRQWVETHVSDYSGIQHRQQCLLRWTMARCQLKDLPMPSRTELWKERQVHSDGEANNAWKEEEAWMRGLIESYPEHESLWYHLRFISFWIRWFGWIDADVQAQEMRFAEEWMRKSESIGGEVGDSANASMGHGDDDPDSVRFAKAYGFWEPRPSKLGPAERGSLEAQPPRNLLYLGGSMTWVRIAALSDDQSSDYLLWLLSPSTTSKPSDSQVCIRDSHSEQQHHHHHSQQPQQPNVVQYGLPQETQATSSRPSRTNPLQSKNKSSSTQVSSRSPTLISIKLGSKNRKPAHPYKSSVIKFKLSKSASKKNKPAMVDSTSLPTAASPREQHIENNPSGDSLFDEWLAAGHLSNENDHDLSSPDQDFSNSIQPSPALHESPSNTEFLLNEDNMGKLFDSTIHSSPESPDASLTDGSPWLDAAIAAFPDLASALFKPASSSTPTLTQASLQLPTPPLNSITPNHQAPPTPATPLMSSPPMAQTGASRRGRKRTREEPLPNTPQFEEELALKRQKNTDAARRSRMRKLHRMETLEKRVAELEAENARLQVKTAVLESEKTSSELRDKEHMQRIKKLEEQLSEAHRALTARILAAAVPE
ncbi:uncharacterized protein VTP21DRAFT_650 [Calcarisporiella thermophila]|uniref:uncharacterized protein n=1 Tax=Calcarisporiella thermophila TaxID=911321 RepID=UPI003743025E